MAKKEKAEKGGKGGLGATLALMLAAVILGLLFMPTAVVLVVGLLPTLVAGAATREGRAEKMMTVGAMNFAGCAPFLFDLWAGGQSVPHAFALISDPRTIVVIYCAAGAGYIIDWAMGGVVNAVMIQRAGQRQKEIKRRQAELVQRWGPEVTGELPLDAHGFPREAVRVTDAGAKA